MAGKKHKGKDENKGKFDINCLCSVKILPTFCWRNVANWGLANENQRFLILCLFFIYQPIITLKKDGHFDFVVC